MTEVERRHSATVSQAILLAIDTGIEEYTREADALAAAGDYVALGVGLGRLRGLRQALSALERHVEDHVAELLPHKRVEVEGLVMERRSSTTRKQWQSEELLRHLVGDQLVNPDTGENMYRTLLDCLPITGSLGWRVKALQQRGIDVEDWCAETPGRTTIQVYTSKEESDE